MHESKNPDPLPAIIQAWTEELADTRASIHGLLYGLAHIQAHQTGEDPLDLVHTFDEWYDRRYRLYKAAITVDFDQPEIPNLLAMQNATAAIHTDVILLRTACVETLSLLTGIRESTVRSLVDQAQKNYVDRFPRPDTIPHVLRAFFRKKGMKYSD